MSRPNLDVRTGALVTKVVFDGTRAVGVEYSRSAEAGAPGGRRRGRPVRRRDQHAAGAAAVGRGRPGLLRGLGIPVVADLPGVGENLQDHLEVYVQHACTQPVSMQPYLKLRH